MIKVRYQFPSNINPEKQAQIIAVGQTVGSWGAQFSHRAAAMQAHMGQVLEINTLANGRYEALIGFPQINCENDVGSLLTMIFGKFSLAGPARITEITLPDDFGTPAKIGMEGIRQRTGVKDRPLIMGIFKPALGLTAGDHAELLDQVAAAGLDIIKDDEINFNLQTAPTVDRVKACAAVIEKHRQSSGKEILYAVNLSGRADKLVDNALHLIDAGANALLFNAICYGYSCLEAIAAHPEINVPVFTHPALAGAIGGATQGDNDYGIAYPVLLGTLMKYAGADAVLYPAHYGSLPFNANDEFAIRDILRSKRGSHLPSLPVPSAGIHPGIMSRAVKDYGNDVALNAGSAIFDHPQGPYAGTRAFFEALEAVQLNKKLIASNFDNGPLRAALEKWGEEQ